MQTFKDRTGQAWTLDITYGVRKRVLAALDVDLFGLLSPEPRARLFGDPSLLVDVLWLLCEKQAQERGVSDEQFAEIFDGDAMDRAVTAFVDEMIFFSPPHQREKTRQLLAREREIGDELASQALADLLAKDSKATAAEILRLMNKESPSTPDKSTS